MTINEAGDSESDYELEPSIQADPNDDVPDLKAESKGAVENVNSRIIGYHFGGLHFYPGFGDIRAVFVGDPGIPGLVSVKVIYRGTGKRNHIFTVPSQLIVIEEEELPIAIVGTIPG